MDLHFENHKISNATQAKEKDDFDFQVHILKQYKELKSLGFTDDEMMRTMPKLKEVIIALRNENGDDDDDDE